MWKSAREMKFRSDALETVREAVPLLHRVSLIDTKTMRELDVSCRDDRGKAFAPKR